MADVTIKWNPNWERELEKTVAPALRQLAETRTRQYDELIAVHRGSDVETVKAELVRIYSADGGEITDPDLTQHAEAIVAGQRIVFTTG